MRSGFSRMLAVGALCIGLAACGGANTGEGGGGDTDSAGDGELVPFPLGVFSGEIYILDYVAKEQGFFEDHGLDVSFLAPSQGGGAANTFFLGGTLKGWPGNPSTIMLNLEKGEDIKIGGWLDNWIPFAVQVPSDSDLAQMTDASFDEKMNALKGKKVGLTGIGSLVYQSLMAGLNSAGVDESDLTIIAVGPPDTGIAQLQADRINAYATFSRTDAAVLADRADTVEFVSLTDDEAPEQIRAFSSWAIPVMNSLVEENPEVVEGYIAAQKEAYDWAKNNVEASAKIISQEVYNGQYEGIITEALHQLFSTDQPNDFKVTPEAWENLAQLLIDQGQLPEGALESSLQYDKVVLPQAQVS